MRSGSETMTLVLRLDLKKVKKMKRQRITQVDIRSYKKMILKNLRTTLDKVKF
jgi:hypothetical protein